MLLTKILFVVLCLGLSWCVRYGDEQFGDAEVGLFYVFADAVIYAVDPVSLTIVKSITVDHNGEPLLNADGNPITWYDAVYMEDSTQGLRYIFINEGDVYEESDEELVFNQYSYVTVVDVDKQEIVARVQVGPRPVHSYGIYEMNEYWTHPDAEGKFDVIKVDNFSALHADGVEALVDDAAHGKLAVDPDLFPLAYATNTNEQYVYKINVETNEMVNAFPYGELLVDPEQCDGTHAIAYSKVNKHIYIECAGGGGILEWDTATDTLVYQWVNQTGSLYETPDENFVIATHGSQNTAYIFAPQKNGELSSKEYEVSVPGSPGRPLFYPKSTTPEGLHDYLVFFPLSSNTNIYNLLASEVLGRSLDEPGYSSQPFDCVYNMSRGFPLMLAIGEDGNPVSPECGSCAPGVESKDPNAFDPSASGVAWVDLQDVVDNTSDEPITAEFLSAGAVFQGSPYSYSNECAYGRTYRGGKRGSQYIAITADLPQSSVYFVDAASEPPSVHGFVETVGTPKRIVWVPSLVDV